MNIFRILLLIILSAIYLPSQGRSAESAVADQEKVNAQLLKEGNELLMAKKPEEAIQYFEKVAADYEEKFKNHDVKIFSARTQTETLRYLLGAAAEKRGMQR